MLYGRQEYDVLGKNNELRLKKMDGCIQELKKITMQTPCKRTGITNNDNDLNGRMCAISK